MAGKLNQLLQIWVENRKKSTNKNYSEKRKGAFKNEKKND